eukprot:347701-Chlamydomonas_euryale.AAC.15
MPAVRTPARSGHQRRWRCRCREAAPRDWAEMRASRLRASVPVEARRETLRREMSRRWCPALRNFDSRVPHTRRRGVATR